MQKKGRHNTNLMTEKVSTDAILDYTLSYDSVQIPAISSGINAWHDFQKDHHN